MPTQKKAKVQISQKDLKQKFGTSPLTKIEESESETSESDVYSSSDGGNKVPSSTILQEKSRLLREKRERQGVSSADDDIPSNALTAKKEEPKKKSSLLVRVVSSTFLISFMCLAYAAGHLYYSLFLLYSGFKCYWELINIRRNSNKDAKNKMTTVLEWYAPIGFCFYLLPKTFVRRIYIDNDSLYDFKVDLPTLYEILFVHHSFICGMLLLTGLVLFTLSLEKGQYKYQFQRLAWMIISTLLPISGCLFFSFYVYKGYFWLLFTNGSVMINDIMAYVFGKSFGRTKLIALSPNKTVEGFVGGGLSTIVFAVLMADYVSKF